MKEVKVVIGANFGDEGKGLMTDYFCSGKKDRVLNIRFNGTSQAGHTVWRDGKRHVFSHFGSGSMIPGVATYLSSDFYFNPVKFFEELHELIGVDIYPEVYISRESEAITIYDIFFNCIIEEARGNSRHGSCGAGLWEALNRVRAGISINANDFALGREALIKKLAIIRDEYYPKRFADMGVAFDDGSEWYDIWYSEIAVQNYVDLFFQMSEVVIPADDKEMVNAWDYQVYEGAQGLLLDYGNREYMPNLTASYTGSKNVVKLLNLIEDEADVEICYVTRTYFTRHGAGRFETETEKSILDARLDGTELQEETNVTNRWQGSFRWGYFDKELLKKSIARDVKWLWDCRINNIRRSIAFTHANLTRDKLLLRNEDLYICDFVREIDGLGGRYRCAYGKTAMDVCEYGK